MVNVVTNLFVLEIFQRVLLSGILISILCGIVGSIVVSKRITSITGGLSHGALGGIGAAFALGISPLVGSFAFCILASLIVTYFYRTQRESMDTLISLLWSFGMALGILLISLNSAYMPDLTGFLFGNILLTTAELNFAIWIVDIAVILLVALFYREIQSSSFDEEFAEVSGLPAGLIFFLLLCAVSLAIVFSIRISGLMLTISLLTLPAAIAMRRSKSLVSLMVGSVVVSVIAVTLGLIVASLCSLHFNYDLPTGPVIVIILATSYFITGGLKRTLR